MAKSNVDVLNREVGWVFMNTNGTSTNTSGTGQGHGISPALGAGSTAFSFAVQTANALLGGASAISRGFMIPAVLEPTRVIGQVKDTHCLYMEISAHLRSAANVELPGVVNVLFNNLWPPANSTLFPNVANPSRVDLGDWVGNVWQQWEDFSPFTIPTPPPAVASGGNGGNRYESRRVLGLMPGNFVWVSLTNAGTVAAAEWGITMLFRSHPQGLAS